VVSTQSTTRYEVTIFFFFFFLGSNKIVAVQEFWLNRTDRSANFLGGQDKRGQIIQRSIVRIV
jgi:hypothetical protein